MVILKVEDTLKSIFETLQIVAGKLKGGEKLIIVDFSNLRSTGSKTDTVGVTSGVVSFIKVYDSGIVPVQGDGKVCCVLSVRHPEIETFLMERFQSILLGVIVEDDFIESVCTTREVNNTLVNYTLVDPFSKEETYVKIQTVVNYLLEINNVILFRRDKEELKEMGKIEFLNLRNRCPECKGQMSLDNSTCLDCGFNACKS